MSTTLTANRIVNGNISNSDLGAFAIDPIASLQAAETAGTYNTVPNGLDMRTFVLIRNDHSEDIAPKFIMDDGAIGANDALGWRSSGASPAPTIKPAGLLGSVLTPGQAKLYGPFPPRFVGSTLQFTIFESADADGVGGSAVQLAAFYLPSIDELAQTQSATPEEELALPVATATLVQPQTIDVNGVEPTFVDHDTSSVGFGLRLHGDSLSTRGNRRVLWIRNNTGESLTLILAHMYSHSAGHPFANYATSGDGDVIIRGHWQAPIIDDGEEFLLGPYDDRVWRLGDDGLFGITPPGEYMSIRALNAGSFVAGTTSGLDVAWFELAA